MRNTTLIVTACAVLALVPATTRAQETTAEKILRNQDNVGGACKPDDLDGGGCCGAPGRRLCSTLPSCTAPGGNVRRNNSYDQSVICDLPKPSCSPAFAANQAALAQKTPSMDVSFYVTSDIHYWRKAFRLPDQVRHVRLMNAFHGLAKFWPSAIGFPAGPFPAPWGVVMAGDLTTFGQAEELAAYRLLYEPGTISDSIRYPVFHGLGNHDVDDSNGASYVQRMFDFIGDSMGCGVNMDPASHSYSWDWNRLHLIQLNEWAGYKSASPTASLGICPQCPGVIGSGLSWLAQDLHNQVGDSGRPVILIQHLGCDGFSMGTIDDGSTCQDPDSGTNDKRYWTAADRQAFLNIIKPYNIIGLFTGHTHGNAVKRVYELKDSSQNTVLKVDNFIDGAGGTNDNKDAPGDKFDAAKGGHGEFLIVRVTDSYLDVVPIQWVDLQRDVSEDERRDQSTETTRIYPNPAAGFIFNQSGCRKRIGDRFITAPPGAYRLASAGGNLVSVTNTSTLPIPGPFALRIAGPSENASFVDSCVDETNKRSYVLFNLALGQSLAPGATLFVDAGKPFYAAGMDLAVLTPINGASTAGVTLTVAPKTAVPPGSIDFYGPPNTPLLQQTVGGAPWLIVTSLGSAFDAYGRARVNYFVDTAKLPDQSTGSLTVGIQVTTAFPDAQGKLYSRTVPFSLHFKAPVTVQLTASPAAYARPGEPHAFFTATLTHPKVTLPDGTTPLPTGEVNLYDVSIPNSRPLISWTLLGHDILQNQSNCDPYLDDTAIFGDDGVHQYCRSYNPTNSNPWQFSLTPGLHTLIANYEGSGSGDAYFQPADSPPITYRVGQPAASIRVISGNNQTTFTGAAFDSPIVMQVLDAASQPVAGAAVAVDFNPIAASAGFLQATEWTGFTDSTGMATSPRPIANSIAGTFNGVVRVTEPGPTILGNLTMTNLTPTGPPPAITAAVAAKGGPAGARQWTLNFRNAAGPAHGLQLTAFKLTQESGGPCTPVLQTALPFELPALPTTGSTAAVPVVLNFSSCDATARFTASIGVSANAGGYTNQIVIAHQFQ